MRLSSIRLPELTYRVWRVWRRNLDVFMKTYKVNFFPPLLEPILYLVAMGLGLGRYVAPIEGLRYIQWIAPALVCVSMMYSSFFECTYGSFVRMHYQKTFDAIIATPISIEEVIAGEMLWGATRSLISSSIVLAVVGAFGLIASPLALLIPIIAFFAGLTFSSIAMYFTSLAPNIDFLNYPGFLFITPMFLLSGTFFPISEFPWYVQIATRALLPLAHTVSLTRALMLGNIEPSGTLISIGWIAAVTSIFFFLGIDKMKKRLIK